MTGNVIVDQGFENSPGSWTPYESGFTTDTANVHSGSRALRLESATTTSLHGAYQVLALNQSQVRPLYFSAWSRAEGVTGTADSNYSFYLDLQYTDNSWLWGQILRFETGSHDWQFCEGFIVPAKPIKTARIYCLFRNTHTGTVWFDDLSLREVQAEIATFDHVRVATNPPSPIPYGGVPMELTTSDGLSMTLATSGGTIAELSVGGTSVRDPGHEYASGFFVRDVAGQSDFVHVGGELAAQGGNAIGHAASVPALNLDFDATYTVTADRIRIRAELEDTSGTERAVTLYFALPVMAEGWLWGDDIRTSRTVTGVSELANLGGISWHNETGATGYVSQYPWTALSGPAGGLTLGVPIDQPRIMRLICNPQTHQLYAAFDLGLSPLTTKFPRKGWVELVLYRYDPSWGFRAASQGYYDRFPGFFTRRLPPEREGLWVAFSDLAPITGFSDFGIGIHELGGFNQLTFDDSVNVASFRYVSEPWSHWLEIDTTSVDSANYDQVLAYLREQYEQGNQRAGATLCSGVFDELGRYSHDSEPAPWCNGAGGCALFRVNPDPDIVDTSYPLNKAHHDWSASARNVHTTRPGLDGEYIDSFPNAGEVMDFRTTHWAATDTPLSFRTGDKRVGLPMLFATVEFSRWLSDDVHQNLGKWTMANGVALNMPWGVDLFDVTGQETDWLASGSFVPQSDAALSYRRTLCHQKPYCFLMNTVFANFTYELVERYFQVCTFYGFYPSMFSANASSDRYWDVPARYNRDRPLFLTYVPVLKHINQLGWQPVTRATTSDSGVLIERFGNWPDLHFTLRNMGSAPVSTTVTVESAGLGLPSDPLVATGLLSSQETPLTGAGSSRVFGISLDPLATEVIEVKAQQTCVVNWPEYIR